MQMYHVSISFLVSNGLGNINQPNNLKISWNLDQILRFLKTYFLWRESICYDAKVVQNVTIYRCYEIFEALMKDICIFSFQNFLEFCLFSCTKKFSDIFKDFSANIRAFLIPKNFIMIILLINRLVFNFKQK